MSKSTALNELQKIETARQTLVNLEQSAGFEGVSNSDSLHTLINRLSILPEIEYKGTYEENGWVNLNNMYLNDANLQENGGEYLSSLYAIVDDSVDETHFYDGEIYYITSDMEDQSTPIFAGSGSMHTHTWDKTKDLTDAFGNKYRWIALYRNVDSISAFNFTDNDSFPTKTSNNGFGNQILALVNNAYNSLYDDSCNKMIIYTTTNSKALYHSYSNKTYSLSVPSLKTVYSFTKDAEIGFHNCYNLQNIIFNNDNIRSYIIHETKLQNIIIPRIKTYCWSTLDCCETCVISEPQENATLTSFASLLFSSLLKSLTLYPNFNLTPPDLSMCYNLSHDSLVNGIIDKLKDLTGETSKTLKLGAYNLAKLSEEEILVATNKNWTLA